MKLKITVYYMLNFKKTGVLLHLSVCFNGYFTKPPVRCSETFKDHCYFLLLVFAFSQGNLTYN